MGANFFSLFSIPAHFSLYSKIFPLICKPEVSSDKVFPKFLLIKVLVFLSISENNIEKLVVLIPFLISLCSHNYLLSFLERLF